MRTKRIYVNISIIIAILILASSFVFSLEAVQPRNTANIHYQELDTLPVAETLPLSRPLPVYLAELSNLNDYCLFANSGWDGNWYVGSNVCWIEALPPAPPGEYRRAFIGAKLGRMKTQPARGKPSWVREPIPGSIYVSLSSTAAWKTSQGYFLADTRDIPLEGDFENALEGVGESRWFWVEVPLEAINGEGPNFVALWSPTEYLVSTASSPILAAGWGSQKVNSWMNNDVRGYAPLNPSTSLKTAITVFEPAIAIKLVPRGTEQNLSVTIDTIRDGLEKTANKTFVATVAGEGIERCWLEISEDGENWKKHGGYVYSPPHSFTLKADLLPAGRVKARCVAADIWGNTGYSAPAEILISR